TQIWSKNYLPVSQSQDNPVFNAKLPSPSQTLPISRHSLCSSKGGDRYHSSWFRKNAGDPSEGGRGEERNKVPLGMSELVSTG
ncbi:hypothetical protein DFH28DRAFT_880476, partial [Melampsora americana]